MNVLFVRPYTHAAGADSTRGSDALGYGVTCADALVAGLRGRGVVVDDLPAPPDDRPTSWLADALQSFERAVVGRSHDVVLSFHAFWPFTADLRRILDDNHRGCPLVTFTHGSHWDPTDLFRFERYPSLRWADLGNLLAADRVLTVSRHMSDMLASTVAAVCDSAARDLRARLRAVGLPLDLARIDAAWRSRDTETTTVVFNHNITTAKQPAVFLDVAEELLRRTSARVLVTRHVPTGSPWSARFDDLCQAHPERLVLGDDLPIDDYLGALWASHVQISTATHESLGVATLEALATGCRCLLPRIGVYPDLVDGDPEVLYDDPADLLTRLLVLAEDRDTWLRTPNRHAAAVRERFSPERIAALVHAVLQETRFP